DAELLLAHACGVARSQLIQVSEISADQVFDFNALVARRANRVPLQHLTGIAYFRHLALAVGPGVFVPRPETELLVEAAIAYLKTIPAPRNVVDLCSGSGAIALSIALEVPGTIVLAVELSEDAVKWLAHNVVDHAEQLEAVGSHIFIHHGNAGDRTLLADMVGQLDAVVTNPPYIPQDMIPRDPEARDHDPAMALFSGEDGLDVAREVALVGADLLHPGGFFGMEHADVQGESVPALLNSMLGIWQEVKDNQDYNQLPRFTTAVRTTKPSVGR
ncbi:MAG: peptide chain release factor N(5)-glutamine methyltransferase, partial [Actinobacteria bacterium]|nr:peptide chain release factor N(5)-glutamine methyltransferase [Actinomycetota bacterium]